MSLDANAVMAVVVPYPRTTVMTLVEALKDRAEYVFDGGIQDGWDSVDNTEASATNVLKH